MVLDPYVIAYIWHTAFLLKSVHRLNRFKTNFIIVLTSDSLSVFHVLWGTYRICNFQLLNNVQPSFTFILHTCGPEDNKSVLFLLGPMWVCVCAYVCLFFLLLLFKLKVATLLHFKQWNLSAPRDFQIQRGIPVGCRNWQRTLWKPSHFFQDYLHW